MDTRLTDENRAIVRRKLIVNGLVYLLIAIGLYILVYIGYSPMRKSVYLQAEDSLSNQTVVTANIMDEYLERINSICYVIMTNENFAHILRNGWLNNSNRNLDANRIVNLCRNTILTNDFIDEVLVCVYSEANVYISSTGRGYDGEWLNSFFKDERYVEFVESGVIDEFSQYSGGKIFANNEGKLFFAKTYPVTPVGDSDVRSIILIRMKVNPFFGTDSEGILIEDGTLIVKDGFSEGIITFEDNHRGLIMINGEWCAIPGEADNIHRVLSVKSGRIPITYKGILPLAGIKKEIVGIYKREVITYLILMVLLIILIIGHMWTIFSPIKRIIAQASGKKVKNIWFSRYFVAELQSIMMDNAEQRMANRNHHAQKDLEAKKRAYLVTLDNKNADNKAVAQLSEELNLNIQTDSFCFVGIRFVDLPSLFLKSNSNDNEELAINFCESFLIELLREKYKVLYFNVDNDLYFCVSFLDEEQISEYSDIKAMLLDTQRLFRERYAIDFQIGMSSYRTGVDGIRKTYHEVRDTIRYLKLIDARNIVEYSSLSLEKARRNYSSEEIYLLNFIKVGEYEKAKEIFEEIIERTFKERELLPGDYLYEIYSIMSRILAAVNDKYSDRAQAGDDLGFNYDELINFRNLEDLKVKTLHLFDYLANSESTAEEDADNIFVNDVYRIVEDNFSNTELNVTAIAELMGKNLDYVSRTFKRLTGEGLLDHIQKIRIDKAKELIEADSSLTIQQVAASVGYLSCESFARVFKNREGITPGRFKNLAASE